MLFCLLIHTALSWFCHLVSSILGIFILKECVENSSSSSRQCILHGKKKCKGISELEYFARNMTKMMNGLKKLSVLSLEKIKRRL